MQSLGILLRMTILANLLNPDEWKYREMFYNIKEQSLERENSKVNFVYISRN